MHFTAHLAVVLQEINEKSKQSPSEHTSRKRVSVVSIYEIQERQGIAVYTEGIVTLQSYGSIGKVVKIHTVSKQHQKMEQIKIFNCMWPQCPGCGEGSG